MFFTKEPSRYESINDLNSDLVAFYRVLQNHLEEFCKQFKFLLVSREWFEDWNRQLAAGGLTDVQRAAHYYYVQRLSFGGKVTGRTFGTGFKHHPRVNLVRLEEELSAIHLRLVRVTIENIHRSEYIRRYDSPGTFFYLDPPYWGFENLYGKDMFSRNDYGLLSDQLANLKGKFILSINDVPEIRRTFKDYRIKEVQTAYCTRKVSQAVQEHLISNL